MEIKWNFLTIYQQSMKYFGDCYTHRKKERTWSLSLYPANPKSQPKTSITYVLHQDTEP